MDIIKDFGVLGLGVGAEGLGRGPPSVLTRAGMDAFGKSDRMDGQP